MSSFDKVIGYKAIKEELKRYVDILKNIEKYQKFGTQEPSGILLFGPPGVGKTLMANCFIEETGRKCFICRKDKPDGDFVDAIRNTFKEAEANSPAIVFLDDIDKFSNSDFDHCDTEEYVTIQACIDEVKGKNVFVIATANNQFKLPTSLRRVGRFDKIIEVSNPYGKDAEDILKYFLSQKNYPLKLDIKGISKLLEGCSCAEIEAIINDAGIYAGYNSQDTINQKDIVDAFVRVIFNSSEIVSSEDIDSKDYKLSAIHEAGHAVVAEVLESKCVTLVTIDINNERTGGATAYNHSKDLQNLFVSKENRVRELLGGKAATEIVLHTVDIGVVSDMRVAFKKVEDLSDDYCAFGFDKSAVYLRGSELDDKKNLAIAKALEKYYLEAKHILVNNGEFLDKVIDALVQKKTLMQSDIQEIKKTCEIVNCY